MTSIDCPRCGASASGHFCSNCGASLAAVSCPKCSGAVAPGARFCTQCGNSLTGDPPRAARTGASAAAGSGREGSVAWWIAGVSLVALTLVVAWPILRQDESATPAPDGAPFAAGPPGGTPPDLSSMTPIEAADRLYGRVMSAVETGDEATIQTFLPMAISAYDIARPLNADGLYHLASLQRAAADFQGSRTTAEEGLATSPDHLLLLAAAGEASEGLGDTAGARDYWQRFLDVYESERARALEEYQAHEFTLDASVTHAREVVGG